MTESPKNSASEPRFELDMAPEEFRAAGYELVDTLTDFFSSIRRRKLTRAETAEQIREVFAPRELPEEGEAGSELLRRFTPLLIEHSLHNGHPGFMGYITSSAAPLGALADFLAAAINQNCGLRELSPAANEIERQTIDWLAALIRFPRPCGGVMVSGGNVANLLGFLAARHARAPWPVRQTGLAGQTKLIVYASRGTHTWIEKAADVAGLGTEAIRWIRTDRHHRLDPDDLMQQVDADRAAGTHPLLVVGTAGNVSTGAVDPLKRIADIAERAGLWFHVDGAYGAPAATLDDASDELLAIARADSIALDPHKWLYNPIESACILVRDPAALSNAFSYKPTYYLRANPAASEYVNYYEHGLQNTRGFRALKTWLCLQQAGRAGYARRIRHDMQLAETLYALVSAEPSLEAGTRHLSITTFRYLPSDVESQDLREYTDAVNARIVESLIESGSMLVSNAVLDGQQFLRACIVNFRTTENEIRSLVREVVAAGRRIEADMASQ